MGGNCLNQELEVIMDTARLISQHSLPNICYVDSLSFALFFIKCIVYFHSKLIHSNLLSFYCLFSL